MQNFLVNKLQASSFKLRPSFGFTLIEIVVATTLFATSVSMMMVLFNYTLKINRKTEALRQATQGMRNFVEFLSKEIRNGQISYANPLSPCPSAYSNNGDNALGLINIDGEQECIYLSSSSLTFLKQNLSPQSLNPPNFTVNSLKFFVRPTTDPYTLSGVYKPQPFVTVILEVTAQLSSKERAVTISYQTTISTDVYDIPHS